MQPRPAIAAALALAAGVSIAAAKPKPAAAPAAAGRAAHRRRLAHARPEGPAGDRDHQGPGAGGAQRPRRAADGRAHPHAGPPGRLRRPRLLPGDRQLHGPDRRSARHRHGRSRRCPTCSRSSPSSAARTRRSRRCSRANGVEEGFVGSLPVVSQSMDLGLLTVDHRVDAWGTYCAGVLGMARSDDPASGNSQFFLMRTNATSQRPRHPRARQELHRLRPGAGRPGRGRRDQDRRAGDRAAGQDDQRQGGGRHARSQPARRCGWSTPRAPGPRPRSSAPRPPPTRSTSASAT